MGLLLVGFTQCFYVGQRLVVNFTHISTLCPVEMSKFRLIVYTRATMQTQAH